MTAVKTVIRNNVIITPIIENSRFIGYEYKYTSKFNINDKYQLLLNKPIYTNSPLVVFNPDIPRPLFMLRDTAPGKYTVEYSNEGRDEEVEYIQPCCSIDNKGWVVAHGKSIIYNGEPEVIGHAIYDHGVQKSISFVNDPEFNKKGRNLLINNLNKMFINQITDIVLGYYGTNINNLDSVIRRESSVTFGGRTITKSVIDLSFIKSKYVEYFYRVLVGLMIKRGSDGVVIIENGTYKILEQSEDRDENYDEDKIEKKAKKSKVNVVTYLIRKFERHHDFDIPKVDHLYDYLSGNKDVDNPWIYGNGTITDNFVGNLLIQYSNYPNDLVNNPQFIGYDITIKNHSGFNTDKRGSDNVGVILPWKDEIILGRGFTLRDLINAVYTVKSQKFGSGWYELFVNINVEVDIYDKMIYVDLYFDHGS